MKRGAIDIYSWTTVITWSVLDSLEYMAVLGFTWVLSIYIIYKEIYYEELTHEIMITEAGKSVEPMSQFESEGWKLL